MSQEPSHDSKKHSRLIPGFALAAWRKVYWWNYLRPKPFQAKRTVRRLVTGDRPIFVELGSARMPGDGRGLSMGVKGLHVERGVPREIELTQAEIARALTEPVGRIVHAVREALEHTEPEIAADIIDAGITMTGGGSLLRDIDAVIADETGLPVMVAANPMQCVALGAGRTLEETVYRGALQPA
jgi:actin-like ATPase involved in cell morphogenesis